jgi:hypothetical protein
VYLVRGAGILSNNSDNYRVPLKPISANDDVGAKKYLPDKYDNRPTQDKYDNRPAQDKYDNRPAQDKYDNRMDKYENRPVQDNKYDNRPAQDKYDNKYAADWSRPSRYVCFGLLKLTRTQTFSKCVLVYSYSVHRRSNMLSKI